MEDTSIVGPVQLRGVQVSNYDDLCQQGIKHFYHERAAPAPVSRFLDEGI